VSAVDLRAPDHHPKCFQNTMEPEVLAMVSPQCDCAIWYILDNSEAGVFVVREKVPDERS
jgi:hypothetical protein